MAKIRVLLSLSTDTNDFQRQQAAVAALQSLKSSIKLDSFAAYDPGRDGGENTAAHEAQDAQNKNQYAAMRFHKCRAGGWKLLSDTGPN